jgi:uncharacterized protein YhbP (UPF0306 family)
MSFIIMTETETRHGAMMLGHQRVSGTIAGQTRTVACIRGLQFRGTAHILDSAPTAERTMYCRRFPVARLSKAPIWRIDIDEGKMTDNTLGFGTKLVWTRPPTP